MAELTRAERRIAEGVVGGRRNGEIAADLGLSARTVEWHLSNLYRKLGVRSRTELAVRFAVAPKSVPASRTDRGDRNHERSGG